MGKTGRDYIDKGNMIDENCISIRELGLYTVFEVSHAYMIYSFG